MASIQDFDEFNMAEKRLNALAGRFRALSLTAPREQQLKLLSAEDLASVVAAFNPDTSVFSSEAVCWRNWTMFLVLLDTGIRKGALMGLRLEDLPIAPSTLLKIVRRPDAVEDPRNDRPQVKTYSRSVTLSKTSIKAIHTYIEKYRPDHACSPYIFLNDSGDGPLSLQGLDSAFLKVSTFIDIHTTPHKLRHTRHYNRLIDLARAGEENFMEIVRVEGGWAPRNEYTGRGGIPDTYKRQFLIDMANNTAPLFLDKILSTAMKAEVPGGK
jgi:integrase